MLGRARTGRTRRVGSEVLDEPSQSHRTNEVFTSMKEAFQIIIVVSVGFVAVASFGSWLMAAWWTIQFMSVRSRVILEIKPYLPSIEKELGFFSNPKNQNTAIPPLLKELSESHDLSNRLSPKTKENLKIAIAGVTLYRRAFFVSCGVGVLLIVVTMIIAAVLSAFFPNSLL